MPLAGPQAVDELLACPVCRHPLRRGADGALACAGCGAGPFDRCGDRDVLIDFADSVLEREATLASGGSSVVRRGRWKEWLGNLVNGRNGFAPHYARDMIARLEAGGNQAPAVLVIGGGQVGNGSEALYASACVRVIALDIYLSPDVTLLADAHRLPLRDGSVDAVWIQSVLEHALEPWRIVEEIHRVLKPGGLVFADTSFLWPVCEGGYDFTRFTANGHRWLFRRFEVIDAGSSSGPGTVALVALRYLAQSLLRSTRLGQIATFPLVWLRFLDRLCDTRRGIDAAGGTFLYGRKAEAAIDPVAAVAWYEEQPMLEARTRALRE